MKYQFKCLLTKYQYCSFFLFYSWRIGIILLFDGPLFSSFISCSISLIEARSIFIWSSIFFCCIWKSFRIWSVTWLSFFSIRSIQRSLRTASHPFLALLEFNSFNLKFQWTNIHNSYLKNLSNFAKRHFHIGGIYLPNTFIVNLSFKFIVRISI